MLSFLTKWLFMQPTIVNIRSIYKGYYLDTSIEGSRYLHTWGNIFLQCLTVGCLIGQLGGRVVHSRKLLGISQNHSFCTCLAVDPIAQFQPVHKFYSQESMKVANRQSRKETYHGRHALACQYISNMNQTIKHLCC